MKAVSVAFGRDEDRDEVSLRQRSNMRHKRMNCHNEYNTNSLPCVVIPKIITKITGMALVRENRPGKDDSPDLRGELGPCLMLSLG